MAIKLYNYMAMAVFYSCELKFCLNFVVTLKKTEIRLMWNIVHVVKFEKKRSDVSHHFRSMIVDRIGIVS